MEALKTSLEENIQQVKSSLGDSGDIILREIPIGQEGKIKAGIFYTKGLVNTSSVHNFIIESLMLETRGTEFEQKLSSGQNALQLIKDFALTAGEIKDVTDFETLFNTLL